MSRVSPIRWVVAGTAAVLVAALAAGPAAANLRGCIKCVDGTDIAKSSIVSKHIVDGTIKAEDLAEGALGGGGAAGGVLELFGSTTATAAATLESFAVTAPGAGSLIVTVAGTALVASAPAPPAVGQVVSSELALCDTADSFEACGATHLVLRSEEPDNLLTNNVPVGFTLSRTVAVTGGPREFHVNGLIAAPASSISIGSPDGDAAGQTFVTVQFVPAGLTIAALEPAPAP